MSAKQGAPRQWPSPVPSDVVRDVGSEPVKTGASRQNLRHGLVFALVIVGLTSLVALPLLPWEVVLVTIPVFILVLAGFLAETWVQPAVAFLMGVDATGYAPRDPPGWRRYLFYAGSAASAIFAGGMAIAGPFDISMLDAILVAAAVLLPVFTAGLAARWIRLWRASTRTTGLSSGSPLAGPGAHLPTVTGPATKRPATAVGRRRP